MTIEDPAFREALCDRILMVQQISGLSMSAFARQMGISPSFMTFLRNYKRMPSLPLIKRICDAYSLPADYFFYGKFVRPKPHRGLAKQVMDELAALVGPPA